MRTLTRLRCTYLPVMRFRGGSLTAPGRRSRSGGRSSVSGVGTRIFCAGVGVQFLSDSDPNVLLLPISLYEPLKLLGRGRRDSACCLASLCARCSPKVRGAGCVDEGAQLRCFEEAGCVDEGAQLRCVEEAGCVDDTACAWDVLVRFSGCVDEGSSSITRFKFFRVAVFCAFFGC